MDGRSPRSAPRFAWRSRWFCGSPGTSSKIGSRSINEDGVTIGISLAHTAVAVLTSWMRGDRRTIVWSLAAAGLLAACVYRLTPCSARWDACRQRRRTRRLLGLAARHSTRRQRLGRSGAQLGGLCVVHAPAPELFVGGSIFRRGVLAGDRPRGETPVASAASIDGSRLESCCQREPLRRCAPPTRERLRSVCRDHDLNFIVAAENIGFEAKRHARPGGRDWYLYDCRIVNDTSPSA